MPVAEPSAKKKKTKRKVGSSNDEYNVKSEIGIHGIAKMYPISRPDLISLFIANEEDDHAGERSDPELITPTGSSFGGWRTSDSVNQPTPQNDVRL